MKYDREKVVNYLENQINKHIEFDNCPGNDEGWYLVRRENIYKILDGLIPMLKLGIKHTVRDNKIVIGSKSIPANPCFGCKRNDCTGCEILPQIKTT